MWLASVFADAGDAARLGPLADSLVARFPDRPDARYYRATALGRRVLEHETARMAALVAAARAKRVRAR